MKFQIKNLDGETLDVELSSVTAVFPDDDVIYIDDNPCQLSSARPSIQLGDQEVNLIADALR